MPGAESENKIPIGVSGGVTRARGLSHLETRVVLSSNSRSATMQMIGGGKQNPPDAMTLYENYM